MPKSQSIIWKRETLASTVTNNLPGNFIGNALDILINCTCTRNQIIDMATNLMIQEHSLL